MTTKLLAINKIQKFTQKKINKIQKVYIQKYCNKNDFYFYYY